MTLSYTNVGLWKAGSTLEVISPKRGAEIGCRVQTTRCVPSRCVAAPGAERPVRQVASLHRPQVEPLAAKVADGEGLALRDRRGTDGALDLPVVVAHDGSEVKHHNL